MNGVIALAFPPWFTGYALIIIFFGFRPVFILYPMHCRPSPAKRWPICPRCKCIEWMRSAYYEGYGGLVLDRAYVIGFACVTIFLGLLLERAMRGHLLAKR